MSATQLRNVGELDKALSVDQHGIEPIPDGDRDSTAWQQFWIWFGANLSPLAWVVGAIGPELGLSLLESIVIMVIGQALGALIFGVFALMGKRTGVSQLALSRMAFGRRGNNIPSIINGVIVLGWLGVNTYVVLIRTFEKWTVPVLGVVMAVMTVLAFSKGHIVWNHSTVHGSGLITAASELMTAAGIGWGFGWSAWASDYSRFTRPEISGRRLYWASALGTFLALSWLGVLGAAMASSATNSDPAELVASLFGVMTIPVLLVIIHGAVAGNIACVYSAPLCFLAGGIKMRRWRGSIVSGVIGSVVLIGFLASSRFVTSFTNYMDSFVIWTAAWGRSWSRTSLSSTSGESTSPRSTLLLRRRAMATSAGVRSSRWSSGWWQDGPSSTARCRCSRDPSHAPPAAWTSRGWRRSCVADWRIGSCPARSRS